MSTDAIDRYHKAILAIVADLAKGDPAPDSEQGKLLVRLADAVEAYERATLPPPLGNAGVGASEISSYDAASLYCWNEPPADGVDAPVEAIDTSAQPVEKDGANRHDSGVAVPDDQPNHKESPST